MPKLCPDCKRPMPIPVWKRCTPCAKVKALEDDRARSAAYRRKHAARWRKGGRYYEAKVERRKAR